MIRRRLIDRKIINIITIFNHRAKPTGFLREDRPRTLTIWASPNTGVRSQNSEFGDKWAKMRPCPLQVATEARIFSNRLVSQVVARQNLRPYFLVDTKTRRL